MTTGNQMTHAEFAQADETFKVACEIAHVRATKRQAAKFRNGTGSAFRHKALAVESIEDRKKGAKDGAK